jgi:hypothetical protein|nr:MAG TPA: hypothetical protein [Caudoviricetes sp.]
MKAILRDRIIQSANLSVEIGGITTEQMDNLSGLYTSYSGLNGNGMITELYKKTMALPTITSEEFRRRRWDA